MPASTTAVIVNYRRYRLLEACLSSLLSSSLPPAEIVVVDNASEAAELARVENRFRGSITTIADAGNDGYAAACNRGWRAARSELVLFLNADVELEPDCLAACVAAMEADGSIGVVTCRLVRPDGRLDHACHRGVPTPLAALAYALKLDRLFPAARRLARYRMAWLDRATVHDVEVCSGAFMLVRRALLEELGGWDERYWFYGEDVDLCLRVAAAGMRVRYVGTASALHVKGASSLLGRPRRELAPAEIAHRRRIQRAIIESHALLFRDHLMADSPRGVSALILALLEIQRVRHSLAGRLDGLVLSLGR